MCIINTTDNDTTECIEVRPVEWMDPLIFWKIKSLILMLFIQVYSLSSLVLKLDQGHLPHFGTYVITK
jgi:hypothetical protein